jgi:hypothetical protein
MNRQLSAAPAPVEAVCKLFPDCSSAATRDFVAAGLSWVDGAPRVVVLSQNPKETQATIAAAGGGLIDQVSIFDARPFEFPVTSTARTGAAAHRLRRCGGRRGGVFRSRSSWLRQLLQKLAPAAVCASTELEDPNHNYSFLGTLGCGLRDPSTKQPYFLTAGHVLRYLSIGDTVGDPAGALGTFKDMSLPETGPGLDWALIEAQPGVYPATCITAAPNLQLGLPMDQLDFDSLLQPQPQTIGVSGAGTGQPSSGSVFAIRACAALKFKDASGQCVQQMRHNQIIVQNSANQLFGDLGDSGAIAYLTTQLMNTPSGRSYAPGTALGLYWRATPSRDFHLLAPIADILGEIHARHPHLALEPWT